MTVLVRVARYVRVSLDRAIAAAALAGALLAAPTAAAAPFDLPLPIPPVLEGAEITIPVQEADVQVLPGAKTRMWTFAGSFPGPTIRRPAGSLTKVTFVNELPGDKGALSIHNHGEHVASADDGQPDDELIAPGSAKTYTYDLRENGGPERPAFQWYHDHRLDVTGRNVWNGLAGMFIVTDPEGAAALPLPEGEYDVPLMFADRSFDSGNQLTYPDPVPFGAAGQSYPGTNAPPDDLMLGTRLLVNGIQQPHFSVAARRYRLRLLNASNGRVMTFSLEGGRMMDQIATESGLLPAPVERAELRLGPAERAEVIVDFSGLAIGSSLMLRAGGADVMQFRIDRTAPDATSVPDTLLPAPDLGTSVRTRSFNLNLVEDAARGRAAWAINSRTFDHLRTDAAPKLGTTETWTFRGSTRAHVVHIHGTDFRVLSRDGAPPPPWEAGLKESILVDAGESVVVQLRFTDHLGAFVFHCHVLEHEDNGMMARYVVSKDGDGGSVEVEPPPTGDGGGDQETAPPPTPPPGVPEPVRASDLALSWEGAPRTLRRGGRGRLRLRVRSTGTAPLPAFKATVRLSGGLLAKGRRRVGVSFPSLAPGSTHAVRVAIRAPRRLRRSTIIATAGAHRSALTYSRKGNVLRRSPAKGVAARAGGVGRALLCRL